MNLIEVKEAEVKAMLNLKEITLTTEIILFKILLMVKMDCEKPKKLEHFILSNECFHFRQNWLTLCYEK